MANMLLNLGAPDRDVAEDFRNAEEEKMLIMADGREVRLNDTEPNYGILANTDSHFLSNPSGCVALHIIVAKKLKTSVIARIFPSAACLHHYVRVDFGERQYFSALMPAIPINQSKIVFDYFVTLTIDDVAVDGNTDPQQVTINLIAVDGNEPRRHIIIGQVEKPLLEIVRNMISSEVLVLTRPAKINPVDGGYEGTRVMGTLLVKTAFAYGKFGYGHSNQIFDERMIPADAIRHSLYPRFSAPNDRIQDAGRVLRFRNLALPAVFPFEVPNNKIGNALLRFDQPGMDPEEEAVRQAVPWLNPRFPLITQLSKDTFTAWKQKYDLSRGGTRQRLDFLREICSAEPGAYEGTKT